jgi:hypothetical protein
MHFFEDEHKWENILVPHYLFDFHYKTFSIAMKYIELRITFRNIGIKHLKALLKHNIF